MVGLGRGGKLGGVVVNEGPAFVRIDSGGGKHIANWGVLVICPRANLL